MPRTGKKHLLPNGPTFRTSASLAFDLHYAHLNIQRRWDRERYDRLARFLGLTRYELASLVCWRHSHVETAMMTNTLPGPVCLLLTLLEAQAMKNCNADAIAQDKIFPTYGGK